jgi:DNA-binding FadR family transcriptional regulator
MFQPVRTRRAFEAVCDSIRAQLARGELHPGDRLPNERELAEMFATGRGPVREALRSLEMSGLVEARTGINGGFFIRGGDSGGLTQTVQDMVSLEQASIGSVTEARIELACVAIRLACARATEDDLAAIQHDIDLHVELFRKGHGSRNTRSVIEFYRLIAKATHNPVIVMMVDALSEVIRELLARVDPRPNEDIMVVRQRVLDLMRERDAQAAMDAMAHHLRRVNDYLVSESTARPADRKTKKRG